ncbi:hypothetical protein V8C44DRAFT_332469 [Trichoderma aethiopicum]
MEMGQCTLTPSLKVKSLASRYACMYEGSSQILLRARACEACACATDGASSEQPSLQLHTS